MSLSYFVIEGSETLSEYRIVDAATGTKMTIRYHSTTNLWIPEQEVSNWDNEVRFWDGWGQSDWIQKVAEPAARAIDNALKGYAFADPDVVYPDLPTYTSTTQAFRKFGWVFVPYNTPDPRSQEITAPPGESPPSSGWTDPSDGGDGDESGDLLITEEPSVFSTIAKLALVIGSGAATWFVSNRVINRYF